jgi:toxin ParE1/3/4
MVALYRYLERRFSDDAAVKYIRRIDEACLSLAHAPVRGYAVSDRDPELRVVGFERRVSILIRVGEDVVEILRVLYGGQDIQKALDRLPKS